MVTNPPPAFTTPPSAADIEELAKQAFATIPETLASYARDVVVRIEEFPDRETCARMRLRSPYHLLGLYHGVSLGRKSVLDVPRGLDMIFLYRRPILEYWVESGETLYDLVRNVLIHEIGHHFGLSDAEMERLEREE